MRALVVGGAGVLGSSLVELLLEKGFSVRVMDIVRQEEAWRLSQVMDEVEYEWKSVFDLSRDDLEGVDVVFDSMAQADRPLGHTSPYHTVHENVISAIRLLEAARKLDAKRPPYMIYPSSLNEYYALGFMDEGSRPLPSSVYGLSKAMASMAFETYRVAYGLPTIVTVVGSAFGPRMRSDELIARMIIYGLRERRFTLRSPKAMRLWTYSKDVVGFYSRLLEMLPEAVGRRLICAGNRGDEIVTNEELAERMRKLVGLEYDLGEYEPGELIGGRPVSFSIDASKTRGMLRWRPSYSLDEGLRETVAWFRENLWRYL